MTETPGRPFNAMPDAVVKTNWQVIGTLIVLAFGAGGWATWMTFKVDSLDAKVAEILSELKSARAVADK